MQQMFKEGVFNMQYGRVHCLSCNLKCEILPLKEFRSTQCLNTKICVWPAVNFLFKDGLEFLINSVDVVFRDSGFIFIDFSWKNIRIFINEGWIDYLEGTEMKIVLLSDKKMMPLAAWYVRSEPRILEVIFIQQKVKELKASLQKVFVGLPLQKQAVRALKKAEKEVLYLTLNNFSVAEISVEMNLDKKIVYNLRQRIESKMGMKIRRFI
ncbi:helix-turn-helix transcriptional regulator [Klebsiella oxytoca]|uniref:helix-turn-helix transcriptional regulator n=1 Tax=Klebsiella oxytoca TaxID=571 RepID=UPI001D0F0DAB|nr:helix-turn-helix transcriptional regulator [Klebsiella oxytoca]